MASIYTRNCILITSLACLLSLSGCHDYSPDSYTPENMQQVHKTERAVVQSSRKIDIHDPRLGVGTVAGGVAGAVAGAQIGEGKGSVLAAVGGAVVGAVAGTLIEDKITDDNAYEYVLQKQNGDLVTIAQKQQQPFASGTRVLIISGKQARVIADNTPEPSDNSAISK